MADIPVTGSASYIQYDFETTFKTLAPGTYKAFGHNQRITVDRNANITRVWGLGSPEASKVVAGRFEGRLNITFDLASTYFLKAVMGKVADGGATPYTHTYTYNTGYTVTSISVENGITLGEGADGDSLFKYLGCLVDSCEMAATIGDAAKVILNCLYATETKATSGIDATPAVDAEDILIFSEGSLDIPSGSTLARVQRFTLRIVRNAELVWGLGNRTATKGIWKVTEFNFELDLSYENADLIEDAYGQATGPLTTTIPAGEASLVLTFTNGGAGALQRSLVITLTTTFVNTDSLPQDPGAHMVLGVTGFSLGETSIIGSDNTAATP